MPSGRHDADRIRPMLGQDRLRVRFGNSAPRKVIFPPTSTAGIQLQTETPAELSLTRVHGYSGHIGNGLHFIGEREVVYPASAVCVLHEFSSIERDSADIVDDRPTRMLGGKMAMAGTGAIDDKEDGYGGWSFDKVMMHQKKKEAGKNSDKRSAFATGAKKVMQLAEASRMLQQKAGIKVGKLPNNSGKAKQRFFFGHSTEVTCLDYNHAKRVVASGQVDPKGPGLPFVCVWRAADMMLVSVLVYHEARICCVGISPKGDYLFSMGRDDAHTVAIWASGQFLPAGSERVRGFDAVRETLVHRIPVKVASSGKTPSFASSVSFLAAPFMFATYDTGGFGRAHLKVWRFRPQLRHHHGHSRHGRGGADSEPNLVGKDAAIAADVRAITAIAWTLESNMLLACADNGYLYLYEGTSIKRSIRVSPASPLTGVIDCCMPELGFLVASADGFLHLIDAKIASLASGWREEQTANRNVGSSSNINLDIAAASSGKRSTISKQTLESVGRDDRPLENPFIKESFHLSSLSGPSHNPNLVKLLCSTSVPVMRSFSLAKVDPKHHHHHQHDKGGEQGGGDKKKSKAGSRGAADDAETGGAESTSATSGHRRRSSRSQSRSATASRVASYVEGASSSSRTNTFTGQGQSAGGPSGSKSSTSASGPSGSKKPGSKTAESSASEQKSSGEGGASSSHASKNLMEVIFETMISTFQKETIGHRVAIGCQDSTILIVDLLDRCVLEVGQVGHRNAIAAVARRGNLVATGSTGGDLRFWNLRETRAPLVGRVIHFSSDEASNNGAIKPVVSTAVRARGGGSKETSSTEASMSTQSRAVRNDPYSTFQLMYDKQAVHDEHKHFVPPDRRTKALQDDPHFTNGGDPLKNNYFPAPRPGQYEPGRLLAATAGRQLNFVYAAGGNTADRDMNPAGAAAELYNFESLSPRRKHTHLQYRGGSFVEDPDPTLARKALMRPSGISALAFCEDYLAIGFDDGFLRILDFPALQPVDMRPLAEEQISCLTFSPNEQLLIAGSFDQLIYVLDVRKRKLLATLSGNTSSVLKVAVSHDNHVLMTNSSDGALLYFDLRTFERFGKTRDFRDVSFNHAMNQSWATQGIWASQHAWTSLTMNCVASFSDIAVTGDDDNLLKLFPYPATFEKTLCKDYSGHAGNVLQTLIWQDDVGDGVVNQYTSQPESPRMNNAAAAGGGGATIANIGRRGSSAGPGANNNAKNNNAAAEPQAPAALSYLKPATSYPNDPVARVSLNLRAEDPKVRVLSADSKGLLFEWEVVTPLMKRDPTTIQNAERYRFPWEDKAWVKQRIEQRKRELEGMQSKRLVTVSRADLQRKWNSFDVRRMPLYNPPWARWQDQIPNGEQRNQKPEEHDGGVFKGAGPSGIVLTRHERKIAKLPSRLPHSAQSRPPWALRHEPQEPPRFSRENYQPKPNPWDWPT
ncbi:unnamed protein product [Amoebophrya sp. A25]|nr:unnamed protein product [Amoebophrya sp. A25]|eukprot:GSA25T00025697001.1